MRSEYQHQYAIMSYTDYFGIGSGNRILLMVGLFFITNRTSVSSWFQSAPSVRLWKSKQCKVIFVLFFQKETFELVFKVQKHCSNPHALYNGVQANNLNSHIGNNAELYKYGFFSWLQVIMKANPCLFLNYPFF